MAEVETQKTLILSVSMRKICGVSVIFGSWMITL